MNGIALFVQEHACHSCFAWCKSPFYELEQVWYRTILTFLCTLFLFACDHCGYKRDYVLIELDEDPETLATSSGVVIANQVMADTVPCEGTVVKVGEGRMASEGQLTKSPVSNGDRVKFKDYAGNDVQIEGRAYSLVKMVDILSTSSKQ